MLTLSSSPNYPKPLQSLYDPKFLKLGYTDLLSTCAKVDLHVNEDMVSAVESATRDQSFGSSIVLVESQLQK